MAPLIQLRDIALTFGGTPLLSSVELTVSAGERVCLVGRNGSGKSTLLRIAAGLIEPDRGTRFVQPDAAIRYLPQEPDFAGAATTLAYVEAGLGPGDDPYAARYWLEQLGLRTSFLQKDPMHPTGTVKVKIDPRGQPTYQIAEGVALLDVRPQQTGQRFAAVRARLQRQVGQHGAHFVGGKARDRLAVNRNGE